MKLSGDPGPFLFYSRLKTRRKFSQLFASGLEFLLRPLAFSYLLFQFFICRGKFPSPFDDPLFQFLVQPLYLLLGLH